MKKTLIALAVAASAVVSGSAMAWTANGSGGNVELGGTLTPVEKSTPWEVQIGAAATDLNGQIKKGLSEASIVTGKSIPVLGIRVSKGNSFKGEPGITPNIDYQNTIDTSKFSANKTVLTLTVNDEQGHKIGTLNTKLSAMGRLARAGVDPANMTLFASDVGHAFFGGLPASANGIDDGNISVIGDIFPNILAHFDGLGVWYSGKGFSYVNNRSATYSAAYGAGIVKGEQINIMLDTPAAADAIVWRASLPVIVSYQ
ncbi:hypothetical protein D6Q91_26215 [Salmonella enterica subsp. enterica]|nr:hypothetical protein [Salmonella enterica subsp. enterica serovar Braenderup]